MSKLIALIALLFLDAGLARAQPNPGGNPGGGTNPGGNPGTGGNTTGSGLTNPLSVGSFEEFLTAILNGVVTIGTIVLVMMLVYVGFLFVVAQGKSEELQKAKSALVWTIIGGLVLLGATSIQLVIQGTVDSIRP